MNVELLSSADVAECMLLGTATGKAKSRWSASRTDMSAVNEARAMARREAVYIGGNVLVEKSALLNGRQTFSVYSCP
ncbi:MAG: DUF4156 domain-containing protein [Gammaproteobacteria bacterium]|nr:DUF4156 domain-containing protein [Gammaproteobacteria bacterium]